METGLMSETRYLPVGAMHADDDTECHNPEACKRMTYYSGGCPGGLTRPTLGE